MTKIVVAMDMVKPATKVETSPDMVYHEDTVPCGMVQFSLWAEVVFNIAYTG